MDQFEEVLRKYAEPFERVLFGIYEDMHMLEEKDLHKLIEICNYSKETNCWWAIKKVVPYLEQYADMILFSREQSYKEFSQLICSED